ncbi:MAG: hypothetical protein IJT87_03605 [Ruminiclostridium sp.]|nr:hypothetical protein [Ruminiclostridium sp.]
MSEQKYASRNPWHGCTKYSEGCRYCYVYRQDEAITERMMKVPELHIWFNDDYPEDTLHLYPEAAKALIRGKAYVDTTQISVCSAEWLCKG